MLIDSPRKRQEIVAGSFNRKLDGLTKMIVADLPAHYWAKEAKDYL